MGSFSIVGASIACASLASSPSVVPTGAYACSCDVSSGPTEPLRLPRVALEDFPVNGAFIASGDWRDEAGAPLVLVRDEARSDELGVEVRRSAELLSLGATFFDDAYCPGEGRCGVGFVVTAADEVPPGAASITRVTVELADDAPETGSGCQADTLILEIDGRDDTTPDEALGIVAWAAATEADLALAEPAAALAFDTTPADAPRRATIRLGQAAGHLRDGTGLSIDGPFCFAVALLDRAGNVGARSEAHCLDTTDPTDPSVELVPYAPGCSGLFCAARPGAARGVGMPMALAALGWALITLRRRARPTPTRQG